MIRKMLGIAAGLLLLAGCTNNDFIDNGINPEGQKRTISTISASMDEADTRVQFLNNHKMAWEADDQILVFSDTSEGAYVYSISDFSDPQEAVFSGRPVTGTEFYSIYPAGSWDDDIDSSKNEVLIPWNYYAVYDGKELYYSIPMFAKSSDNNMIFRQLGGLLHFQIYGKGNLEWVELSANNEDLTGPDNHLFCEAYSLNYKANEIKLDPCSNYYMLSLKKDIPSYTLSESKPFDIYFSLPAGLEMNHGIKLRVGYSMFNPLTLSRNKYTYEKISEKPFVVERATIGNFPAISVTETHYNTEHGDNYLETMADVIVSSAWKNTGGNLNTYAAVFVEHEAGVDSKMSRAEMRSGEPTNASTYNDNWVSLYETLRNLHVILSYEKIASDLLVKGVAEIMTAYNLAILTDLFGDVPFSESFNTDEIKQPKLDSQQELYTKIFYYLDQGIADVKNSTSNTLKSYDLIYRGNATLWVRFAYSLKARYTMHQLKRSGYSALQSVLNYVDQGFAAVYDQATYNVYNIFNQNPTFAFEWKYDALSASKSAYDKLAERNDPRIDRLYWDGNTWEHLYADELSLFENGISEPGVYRYSYTAYMFAQTADTYLMSYRELLFLKAEALVRLGRTSEAEPVLKEAIELSFANVEAAVYAACTSSTLNSYGGIEDIRDNGEDLTDADAYFDAEVKPRFAANPLKETLIQKYLSLWGANSESLETFNDVRRLIALGEVDLLELKNPKQFPLRYTYGSSDTTTNQNVSAAYGNGQYVYSEPVWWAGGNR